MYELVTEVSMGHVLGFRGPYGAYTRPQRSLLGICAENVTQTGIDMSRNYFILYLRKTKYSGVARVRARTTLEINEKNPKLGLEPRA